MMYRPMPYTALYRKLDDLAQGIISEAYRRLDTLESTQEGAAAPKPDAESAPQSFKELFEQQLHGRERPIPGPGV